MTSSPDSLLLCSACGDKNAPDSKFCRHCGHALQGVATAVAASLPTPSASPMASGAMELPDDILPAMVEGGDAAEARSSPGEIDARHARRLLERAQGLADRADIAGALLATRQAIALAPNVANGHAMLGALLERTGDPTHAIQALERASQLAPQSDATRELARLRGQMSVASDAPTFHFNDAELFDDEISPASESDADSAPKTAAILAPAAMAAAAVSATSEPTSAATPETVIASDEAAISATEADSALQTANDAIPLAAEAALSSPNPEIGAALPPTRERRVADVPVAVESRVDADSGAAPRANTLGAPLGTPIGSRVQMTGSVPVAAPVVNPVLLSGAATNPTGWSAMWARPSYFGRSLPLIGATILSLGFLSWARGLSDARNLAGLPMTASIGAPASEAANGGIAPVTGTNPGSTSNVPALAPVGSAPVNNGGFPISNQAIPPSAVPQTNAPVNTPARAPGVTGGVSRPAAANGAASNAARRRASSSGQILAPAPIPAPGTTLTTRRTVTRGGAAPGTGNSGSGGAGDLNLPAPVIAAPAPPAPATSVLPAGGTSALNPAGAAGRGYVRITQGRVGSILPSRPDARAGEAERAAASAARTGSTSQAIDGLTAAINANSSDAGFRFQQRASLFLGQGEYSRAAEDFQSAITAYNEQINRGEQVASARAGLRAARSGLNLALAGGR